MSKLGKWTEVYIEFTGPRKEFGKHCIGTDDVIIVKNGLNEITISNGRVEISKQTDVKIESK